MRDEDRAGRVAAEFEARVDEPPAAVVSAPGRVNLVGGHTDYNDGFVLPAAIDRRVAVAAGLRDDDRVVGHSLTTGETAAFDLEESRGDWHRDREPEPGWATYLRGTVAALAAGDHPVGPSTVVVGGDLPVGAGLASSAALCVGLAGALTAVGGSLIDGGDLVDVARRAETEFVGVDCGIMDQFAAAFGRRDAALLLDCRSREFETVPLPARDAALLAVDTGVSHELAESAYNRRVEECARGVDRLAELVDAPVRTLRDVDPATVETHRSAIGETVARRCEHVVTENERVRSAATALRRGDLRAVGDAMVSSHESLRDRYEVSCAELDAAVEASLAVEGVYGARMTGAGFGGSVVALCAPDRADAAAAGVAERYEDATGTAPEVYACVADEGIRVSNR